MIKVLLYLFLLSPIINSNDPDLDGILSPPLGKDNCPTKSNSNQLDSDKDGKGDKCDPSTNLPATTEEPAKPSITGQSEKVLPPNVTEPPNVAHLRIQIDSIQVYADHDGPTRVDGEWQLFGIVTCCGTAANSNMPTNVYSFNAPGAKEGQIDTPNNDMNDVTGTRVGNWGTVETVKFTSVYQDFDLDNTNPLSELKIDFFGIEDDRITSSDLPPIPDKTGSKYVEAAKYASELVVYLNNLKSVDHLGNVHEEFTKANNYGIGIHYPSSDRIYKNLAVESEKVQKRCDANKLSRTPVVDTRCNNLKDWPDFPDYIINYRIIDRDNPCEQGFTYNYMTNICVPPDIVQ